MSCSCGELNLTLIIMGKHGSYQVQLEHRYNIQTVYPFFDPYGPYGSTHGLYGPLLCGCFGQPSSLQGTKSLKWPALALSHVN